MNIVVVGASGQGRATIDIVESDGRHHLVGVLDDGKPAGTTAYGYPVLGGLADVARLAEEHGFEGGVIGVGDNHVRSKIAERIEQALPSFTFVTAIHATVHLGRDVVVGEGAVLMAGVILNGSCHIGKHALVCTGAQLDHDGVLGAFASMGPGAVTGGLVTIGEFTALALGASVIHGCTIGSQTVVGVGSTVIGDIPSGVVAYGTPCKAVRTRVPGDPYL